MPFEPKEAFLRLAGWSGVTEQRVMLVGETRTRYRIRAIEKTKLRGRSRFLQAGAETFVPRYALRIP